MYKGFTLKLFTATGVVILTACSHASLNGFVPEQKLLNRDVQTDSPSPLAGVDMAHSRDILLKLRDRAANINHVLPENIKIEDSRLISKDKGIYLLHIPARTSLLKTMSDLEKSTDIVYAEPNPSFHIPDYQVKQVSNFNTFTPNDPNFGLQWNMKSSGINQAWNLSKGNKNLKIAVIDSGVDPNHPDLIENLDKFEDVWNEEKGPDVYKNPFTGQTVNYGGKDGNGHGTHVTGIIAATMNNQIGVAGVSGEGVRITPIKATDYAGNTDAAVLTAAFQRAIDRGVRVINISIGGPANKSTQALVDVIQLALQKNISIVSATGNESSRKEGAISPITVPAAYPGVIAVGAYTQFHKVASYSNGGPEIDLVAPGGGGQSATAAEGQQIFSTWPSYQTYEYFQKRVVSTYYAATSGTSMACPHVTGVVALLLSREPNLTPAQIRGRLIATADDIDALGFDQASGYGELNAYRALRWTEHDARD
jgi:subtilisin family serine protease